LRKSSIAHGQVWQKIPVGREADNYRKEKWNKSGANKHLLLYIYSNNNMLNINTKGFPILVP
jgi:hypothetical protein